MKKLSKALSLLLAVAMLLSLAACGSSSSGTSGDSSNSGDSSAAGDAGNEVESNSDYRIAMVTDSGDITDQSFNQTTYEACKAFAEANNIEFSYFKPDSATDDARIAMVDSAVGQNYNVIVLPGFDFAETIVETTFKYPDVKFIALDIGEADLMAKAVPYVDGENYDETAEYDLSKYYNTENTYLAVYQEELAGYMAGYAAVKLGYTKLGFLGGAAGAAVIRYGYGFVQGVNDAAVDLGIADQVSVEYAYGGVFQGSVEITAVMDTWYSNGTEVVFACGGGIYTSACEAAAKVDAKVIGVDVDQSGLIDGAYGEGMTVTSAMKGLAATVNTMLDSIILSDTWSEHVGKIENLGLVSGDDTSVNYVGLPEENTQWSEDFTVEDYKALVADLYAGNIVVSNDTATAPDVSISVNYREGTIL